LIRSPLPFRPDLDPASLEGEGEDFGDEKDTFSIMVATDNHLGYLEKDPVRGDDSFAAFEEILSLAAESEVNEMHCHLRFPGTHSPHLPQYVLDVLVLISLCMFMKHTPLTQDLEQ